MVRTARRGRLLFAGLCIGLGSVAGINQPAAAQWTVTSLHPSGSMESRAHAVTGEMNGVQSGYAVFPGNAATGAGGGRHAGKWT